eukprot:762689-Hanusia_phi.AAC.1
MYRDHAFLPTSTASWWCHQITNTPEEHVSMKKTDTLPSSTGTIVLVVCPEGMPFHPELVLLTL